MPAQQTSDYFLEQLTACLWPKKTNKCNYHSVHVFFPSIGQEPTTLLQIMVCSCIVPSKCVLLQIIFCSCVIGSTISREKWQIASQCWQEVIEIWKQTWWSNDKTVIVSQINYLPQSSASANNWSAGYWQITIFCSTSSNSCKLLSHPLWLSHAKMTPKWKEWFQLGYKHC